MTDEDAVLITFNTFRFQTGVIKKNCPYMQHLNLMCLASSSLWNALRTMASYQTGFSE